MSNPEEAERLLEHAAAALLPHHLPLGASPEWRMVRAEILTQVDVFRQAFQGVHPSSSSLRSSSAAEEAHRWLTNGLHAGHLDAARLGESSPSAPQSHGLRPAAAAVPVVSLAGLGQLPQGVGRRRTGSGVSRLSSILDSILE